ncbi:cytochrome P450 4c3 [Nephila pilipes]|uniref:Cytochrome P450 4c3 n=1 Tax=Nephila pilipes TaxID=299642 RepID=A0A8X6UHJ5_NEPPI|nr:cytochrome P450 4c3 [Nephila pilipes]
MQHIIQSLDEFTNAILQETRKKYLTGELSANDGKRKSLMHLLLEHHLQEKDLNEDGIREEMNTFMLAGSDTTAQSMTWALYLVGLYPEIQAKVHEEIDSIFGSDTESHVTEENMKDMKYSECVLKVEFHSYTHNNTLIPFDLKTDLKTLVKK